MQSDKELESLLSQAGPRPVPSAEDMAAARDLVRDEWHSVVRRRRRNRLLGLAAAATIVVAAFVTFDMSQTRDARAVQVATIERSFGSIYLLGDRSELQETNDLIAVMQGQTVVTGSKSGVAFNLGKGLSLRSDARTRIEFADPATVFLHDGRVYVDAAAAEHTILRIESEHGVVEHVGTQYMMNVDKRELVVSVREGKVAIEGSYHDATVVPGKRVRLSGTRRPDFANVPLSGEHWQWVEALAPAADFDGRSVHEFLEWVSRETGLVLEFESPAAERLALAETLNGRIDTAPTDALRVWMMGIDLDWRIEGGVIYISEMKR
ncbi:MAG: FecR family protein [Woeseiaceae bacterium]|nr:FecR family protein [Woeseiaceae bacterium]